MKLLVFGLAFRHSLAISLLALLLNGCSGFAPMNPLQKDREVFILPAVGELTAVVTLSDSERTEEYLLALRSHQDSFQGAVLTPAGISVASLNFSPLAQRVSTTLSQDALLSPSQLVTYLEMIYMPASTLRSALKINWCLTEAPARRYFLRDCSGDTPQPEYSIGYSGDSPWYATIVLQDELRQRILNLKILEVSNVLSE